MNSPSERGAQRGPANFGRLEQKCKVRAAAASGPQPITSAGRQSFTMPILVPSVLRGGRHDPAAWTSRSRRSIPRPSPGANVAEIWRWNSRASALVSGDNSGLGEAIASRLAAEAASLVVHGRNVARSGSLSLYVRPAARPMLGSQAGRAVRLGYGLARDRKARHRRAGAQPCRPRPAGPRMLPTRCRIWPARGMVSVPVPTCG